MIGLNKRYTYDDGILINNYDINPRALAGQEGGTKRKDGYKLIGVNKKKILVHRLIWEYFKGPIPRGIQVDHIDRDPSNNRIENLRLVTNQENSFNTDAKGAYFDKRRGNWYSQIRKEGRVKCLGSFKTEQEAINAYQKEKAVYHRIKE